MSYQFQSGYTPDHNQYQQPYQQPYDHSSSNFSSSIPPMNHHQQYNPNTYQQPSSHNSNTSWAPPQDAYQPPSHTYRPTHQEHHHQQHRQGAWENGNKVHNDKGHHNGSSNHHGKKQDWNSKEDREREKYIKHMAKEDEDWRAYLRSGVHGVNDTGNHSGHHSGGHGGKKQDWKAKKEWEDRKWEIEKANAMDQADREWRAFMMAEAAGKIDRGSKPFWKKDKKWAN